MSLQRVAQLAGVSTSTVSRVVNAHPSVAADTVATVRDAMAKLSFSPAVRRRHRPHVNGHANGGARGPRAAVTTIAFFVFGTSGSHAAPAFEQLLRGVSEAALDHDLSLVFSFVSDLGHLPPKLAERRVDGVLLHGERPAPAVQARLQSLPTVWLMGNRQRPTWGDQVMPDNTVIGELAAKYLVRRGHRRLAYLGVGKGVWSLGVRSLSFARTASDAGAAVQLLEAADERAGADLWAGDGIAGAAQVLVHQLLQTAPRPTGLFVAEDRLLAAVVAALAGHGLVAGPGADVEIISCNNERPHLIGLAAPPATIDIRAEAIGRRGVEQLLWRMRNPGLQERIRTMVEPLIVEPGRPAQVVTNNR